MNPTIGESLEKSPLGKKNEKLAKDIASLLEEAEKLGVQASIKRVERVCWQFDHIAPEVAYSLIDIEGFQQEIEDKQGWRRQKIFKYIPLTTIHYLRNIFSLLPLILTWLALFVAVGAYQSYLQLHPNSQNVPFLVLWQQGFPGIFYFLSLNTLLSFGHVALSDVISLAIYLGLILFSHTVDQQAYSKALEFLRRLQEQIDVLILEISRAQLLPVSKPQDFNQLLVAIKQVIEEAGRENQRVATSAITGSKQVVDEAKQAIQGLTLKAQESLETVSKRTQESLEMVSKRTQKSLETVSKHTQESLETVSKRTQESLGAVSKHTQESLETVNKHTEEAFSQHIVPLLQTYDDTSQQLQHSLAELHGAVTAITDQAGNFTQQTASFSQQVASVASVGQDIHQSIDELRQSERDVLAQLQLLNGDVKSALGEMNSASQNVEAASIAMMETAQQLGDGQQALLKRMEASENYVQQFQQDLQSLQNRLRGLTAAIDTVMDTADALGNHIQSYTVLGQEVRDQVSLLRQSEDAVRDGLDSIRTSIMGTADHMRQAALDIGKTPAEISQVNAELKALMQQADDQARTQLNVVMNNFNQISNMLRNTSMHMDKITSTMHAVTQRLNTLPLSLSVFPTNNGQGNASTPPPSYSSPSYTQGTGGQNMGFWERIFGQRGTRR